MKVRFEKAPDDVLPKCPFRKYELEKVWIQSRGLGVVEQKQMIICPWIS